MDACSRRIIGWSIDTSQKTDLVVDALGTDILRRRPDEKETVLHSGHGTQDTSWAFGRRLREAGLLGSMGTAG
jgi:putative transposase